MGEHLSIDEVALSQGELYTFVTNKNGRGKKGTLVACIKGTLTKDITEVLNKIPLALRMAVKETTLDMAKNMGSAIRESFINSDLVIDRFHVVRLAMDAVQHVRIKHRWEAIDEENEAIAAAKDKKNNYQPIVLANGDTPKQLLARSRHVLAKKTENWTLNQFQRAQILFDKYPPIKDAYDHVMNLRTIYEQQSLIIAKDQFQKWIDKSLSLEYKKFHTVANSLQYHLHDILNFFKNRNTNANAESFNSKIKLFRANQRGVTDTLFFLFRISKLFA